MKLTLAILFAVPSSLASASASSATFVPSTILKPEIHHHRLKISSSASDENNNHGNENVSSSSSSSSSPSRRAFLNIGSGTSASLLAPFVLSSRYNPALAAAPPKSAAAAATAAGPIADLPMIRLKLPQAAVGREYVVIQLKIDGKGPFDFMVDSGLTTEMITPQLQQTLGITPGRSVVRGLSAGGDSSEALVELRGVSLCCGKFASTGRGGKDPKELALPPLNAVVTDFPQEHIDPSHDVEGMLGMELLDMFDTDLDFPKNRLRLWSPGTAAGAASKAGLVEIPDAVLNETGLLGIRVTSPNAPAPQQPLVGILDCGASFSAVNWAAAKYLGLPPKEDMNAYKKSPTIMGIGIDGRPLMLPTSKVQFTYVGDVYKGPSGEVRFGETASNWKPWDPVTVGIGDLPVFSQLLGDGITPYRGPAVLIGLDVLSQRRVILETGRGRARRMYVGAS